MNNLEFDQTFNFFDTLFPLIFICIIGVIILKIVSNLVTWTKNNNSPQITVLATIIAKRTDVTHHHSETGGASHSTYYITFQEANGQRTEFTVRRRDYGLLAEQDSGILSYQGTRFLDFDRQS